MIDYNEADFVGQTTKKELQQMLDFINQEDAIEDTLDMVLRLTQHRMKRLAEERLEWWEVLGNRLGVKEPLTINLTNGKIYRKDSKE